MAYREGDLSSKGGVDGVRANVARYGAVDCCTFVKGFFADTLDGIDTDSVVLVFEDADLRSSTEDCVRALWPKLRDGCKFYCHEPFSTQVVSLFYDHDWWKDNLQTTPPGFFGSGSGIIEIILPSGLGFAQKFDAASGTLSWSPGSGQSGTHRVRILVDDQNGGLVAHTFEVSVEGSMPAAVGNW